MVRAVPLISSGRALSFLPKNRSAGCAGQYGIFELLAGEKLGPVHHSQAFFESARHYRHTSADQINITAEEFEEERLRLQSLMLSLVERG